MVSVGGLYCFVLACRANYLHFVHIYALLSAFSSVLFKFYLDFLKDCIRFYSFLGIFTNIWQISLNFLQFSTNSLRIYRQIS